MLLLMDRFNVKDDILFWVFSAPVLTSKLLLPESNLHKYYGFSSLCISEVERKKKYMKFSHTQIKLFPSLSFQRETITVYKKKALYDE